MSLHNHSKPFSRVAVELEVQTSFHAAMDKLEFFWMEFGISEEQINERSKAVLEHVTNLLTDLVKEEEDLYENIKRNIEGYEKDLDQLGLELEADVFKPEEGLPLVQKEKFLRTQMENLIQEKNIRVEKYKQLRKTESKLCDMLGMPKNTPMISEIPKKQELYELEQHVHMLSDERERRYRKYCLAKQQLSTILEETDFSPETSFEREVICYDEDDGFVLSQENLEQLHQVVQKVQLMQQKLEDDIKTLKGKLLALWDRLKVEKEIRDEFLKNHSEIRRSTVIAMEREIKKYEEIKKQNIASYIETLRKELLELWEKCFISTSERQHFEPFYSKEYDEDVLQLHDAEVEKLKKYYESTKHIFAKIAKREQLWDMMLVFERKAHDPNRYTNRGGNLLQEEKQRNKLLKELPRLEVEILQDIGEYEENTDTLFLVNGINFSEFIKRQWEEHQREKENERLERQTKRSMLMMESPSIRSTTPCKRPMFHTPLSTPGKLLRSMTGAMGSTKKKISTPKTPMYSASPMFKKKCGNTTRQSPRLLSKATPLKVLSEPNYLESKPAASASNNTTSYSDFASELNKEYRERCRSSVATKVGVLGSKLNRSKNSSRSRKRRSRTSHSGLSNQSNSQMKNSIRSNKSIRNTPRTPTKITPARGKLGLPFLI